MSCTDLCIRMITGLIHDCQQAHCMTACFSKLWRACRIWQHLSAASVHCPYLFSVMNCCLLLLAFGCLTLLLQWVLLNFDGKYSLCTLIKQHQSALRLSAGFSSSRLDCSEPSLILAVTWDKWQFRHWHDIHAVEFSLL